jgi:hypothetical protein|tara:strand:- start:248 stop:487 length:240 start_codon:yes stop_codon:yes gene_type:complete
MFPFHQSRPPAGKFALGFLAETIEIICYNELEYGVTQKFETLIVSIATTLSQGTAVCKRLNQIVFVAEGYANGLLEKDE